MIHLILKFSIFCFHWVFHQIFFTINIWFVILFESNFDSELLKRLYINERRNLFRLYFPKNNVEKKQSLEEKIDSRIISILEAANNLKKIENEKR